MVCLILQMGCFQTIVELMEYLRGKLKEKFAAKAEEVTWTCLSAIRDFQRWMTPLDRCAWNCFANREGIEAPHSFSFKLGRDLCQSDRAWLGPASRSLDVSEDVYCCVKTYMRDTQLQQEPTLILPVGRDERLADEPRDICSRHAMSKEKINNYMKLATKLKDNGLSRAAQALHALVFDRSFSLPAFPWLRSGWRVERDYGDNSGNFFFRHLPASSWRLFTGDVGSSRRKWRRDREGV